MYLKSQIYIPELSENLTFSIYHNDKKNAKYYPLIVLDGQNALFDEEATFHHSLKLISKVKKIEKQFNINIILFSLYSPNDDLKRFNYYSPFIPSEKVYPLSKQINLDFFSKMENFLINNLLVKFQKEYPLVTNKFSIYGSSLGANYAVYLGYKYPQIFNNIGAFSLAHFIYEEEYYNFMNQNFNKNTSLFLYVGKKEKEEETYYYPSSLKFYQYLKAKGIKNIRFEVDFNGIHNEKYWGKHFLSFLSFIFEKDLIIY